MSATTASANGGSMHNNNSNSNNVASESADALLNHLLFDSTHPLPVIQLDQAPLSALDVDPQFAMFSTASNARDRRASLPSELLSGLGGLSFQGDYPMDPLLIDPDMLEYLSAGITAEQGAVDPFSMFNLTAPDAAGLGYNNHSSALSTSLSINTAPKTLPGSKPIPIAPHTSHPSHANTTLVVPPFSDTSDKTLSTSAPQTGSDFFSLFAKSFKKPPLALSTSFLKNNLPIPSPEASPIAGRRTSFSNPSATSPMINRRPSISSVNLGNRRGSTSNLSAIQDQLLHHPLQMHQQTETSILHKPRFSKFKSPSSPTLATLANQSAITAAATATSPTLAAPIMQNFDTRPRDHVCVMCGNKFLRRQDLMRHEVTHSTVKQYACLYACGASFGRSDALGRHMKNGKCRAAAVQQL
ncbi:hypothetical protein HDU78_003084 [Chytriomyces hyalinus]|nr:hypothetical protein HDU78_003084 [Chytriomyces hyalinus]